MAIVGSIVTCHKKTLRNFFVYLVLIVHHQQNGFLHFSQIFMALTLLENCTFQSIFFFFVLPVGEQGSLSLFYYDEKKFMSTSFYYLTQVLTRICF